MVEEKPQDGPPEAVVAVKDKDLDKEKSDQVETKYISKTNSPDRKKSECYSSVPRGSESQPVPISNKSER